MKRWWWHSACAVARRPEIWRTALHQLRVLTPRRWWARPPYVPGPSREWFAFRMETAYGDAGARPSAEDVMAFLEWCRETRLRSPTMR